MSESIVNSPEVTLAKVLRLEQLENRLDRLGKHLQRMPHSYAELEEQFLAMVDEATFLRAGLVKELGL